MLGTSVHYSENTILPGGPNHICHIRSQSFKIAYDEAIIAEWLIGKIGHIAFPIRDVISATNDM